MPRGLVALTARLTFIPANVGINISEKRQLIGRYSLLVDQKPRSLFLSGQVLQSRSFCLQRQFVSWSVVRFTAAMFKPCPSLRTPSFSWFSMTYICCLHNSFIWSHNIRNVVYLVLMARQCGLLKSLNDTVKLSDRFLRPAYNTSTFSA
jgi:hypothetical protein